MTTQYELPKGWRWVRFGDVARQVKDRVDPEVAGIDCYVAGEHMDTDDLRIRRWGTVGDGYLGPAFHMRFQPGHVLYGSRRTYLRKVAIADFEGICANTTFVLEAASGDLLPEFLPLVMTTDAFHGHSIGQSKGSVNPYINFRDIAWYEFALPSRQDQERIVGVCDEFDRYHEALRQAESASVNVLNAALHQLARCSRSKMLAELADLQMGRQRSPKYDRGLRPCRYLRAANLKVDGIDLSDVKTMDFSEEEQQQYSVRLGDVLLVEGGDADKVGAPAYIANDLGSMCIQNTVVRVRAFEEGGGRYLYWALRAAFHVGRFEEVATGTKLYHLGLRKLNPFQVPVEEDRLGIVRRLDGIDSLLSELRSCLQLSRGVRRLVQESLLAPRQSGSGVRRG